MVKKLPLAVAPNASSQSDSLTSATGRGVKPAAGAVHEHVEALELADRAFDESARLVGPRDVAVGASGRDDVPAGAAQQLGERGAELAGAAGQEGAHPSSDSTTDARLP